MKVDLVTLDGAEEVVAAYGLRVPTQGCLSLNVRPEVLLVPGGGWNNRAARGAWAEVQRGDLPAALAQVHQAGTTVAAVCTGTMILAAAGITTNRPAITHGKAVEELRESGARIIEARVVDDGDLITSGGVTSGLDLALWLVERYVGPETAHAVERQMEYERRGTVWRR